MTATTLPEKVVNYNVYDNAEKLVGLASEFTLPTMEEMTETISGAGILGEFESTTPGHFGSMTIDLTFRTLFDKSFSLFENAGRLLTLRAAQQSYDQAGGMRSYRPLKISFRTLPKSLELGKIAVGGTTETKNTMEILYIKVEENGKTLLEFDRLNFVYILNGKDQLAGIKNYI